VEILIASCKVQGEGAAEEIANCIKLLNMQKDIDLIIVGRGGGSLEDLWAFNEEIVARSIFDSKIPVISAVGHEIDFTISDFAADLRAATPSAAMELATPDKEELFAFISEFSYYLSVKIMEIISSYRKDVDQTVLSYGFRRPLDFLKDKMQQLDNTLYRFQNNFDNSFDGCKNHLALLESKVSSHDVNNVLKRGFAIVKQDGKYITRKKNLESSKSIDIKFYDGDVNIK
jgi:exodeoxyribonuclease VII large subunit